MRFSEVKGLENLKAKFVKSIDEERLPHAQLFLGAEGSGKTALAYAVVQYLYCTEKIENDSCGECSSCRKISTFTHPDVHYSFPTVTGSSSKKPISDDYIEQWREINDTSNYFNTEDWVRLIAKDENKSPNITREETKNIIKKLSLKPYEGEAKAMIIWMPEFLAGESNALLKLIEEPPQKTFFILIAENSDALLATITSRTQLIKIPKYTETETSSYLQEKYGLDSSKAEQVAYMSEGNFLKATNLVENVEDNYASIFREWMLACYTNDVKKAADLCDDLQKLGRVQLQLFLTNGLKILRESLLYMNIDNYQIRAEQDQIDFIKKFSKTLNASHVEKSYEKINEAIYHIKRNANAKITLFNLSLSLRYNFIRNNK